MVKPIDIDIQFLEIWWVTQTPFFLIKITQPVAAWEYFVRYGVWGVMDRVLLGFCVGVNRVLLESVECREVCVLGSRERV